MSSRPGSSTGKYTREEVVKLASQHIECESPPSRYTPALSAMRHREKSSLQRHDDVPLSGGFFHDNEALGLTCLSMTEDEEDSELDDSLLFGPVASIVDSFPLPPSNTPIHSTPSLGKARSVSNFSSQSHQQNPQEQRNLQQEQHIHLPSIRQSPLRERRCKQPLTIKASIPPTMRIRRVKSSSSGLYSPPPHPPPMTPLPDLPLSVTGNDIIQETAKVSDHQHLHPIESLFPQSSPLLSADLGWDWNPKSDADSLPYLSSPSSSSTSPSSSRGSSQRRCDVKNSSNLPLLINDSNKQKSLDWDAQLSDKLGLAFALHLDLNSTDSTCSGNSSLTLGEFTSTPEPISNDPSSDDVHIYGFAL